MKSNNSGWHLIPAALGFLLLAGSADAAPRRCHHPRLIAPSQADQQIQVNGLVGGVADQLWRQTDNYFHHGDYPRIVALDRIITQADPQFLEAYATGGWLMDSLGRTQDAEAFYTLGIRSNPHASYAYWNLGFFHFSSTHDYAAAAQDFKQDTEQVDANLNDWKMLAHSYEKAGNWDAAITTWHEIKARWPQGMSVDRLLREAEEKQRLAQEKTDASGTVAPDMDGAPASP